MKTETVKELNLNYKGVREKTPYRLLLIDADQATSSTLRQQLKERGFDVFHTSDVNGLLRLIEEGRFDLVLVEFSRLQASGIEIIKKIREKFLANVLPVVVVTSYEGTEGVIEALHQGANDYIIKPIQIEVMIERIKVQLKLSILNQLLVQKKEKQAVTALITTYNHEINNSLTIAILALRNLKELGHRGDGYLYEALETSFARIRDTVTRLTMAASGDDSHLLFDNYIQNHQMLKLS